MENETQKTNTNNQLDINLEVSPSFIPDKNNNFFDTTVNTKWLKVSEDRIEAAFYRLEKALKHRLDTIQIISSIITIVSAVINFRNISDITLNGFTIPSIVPFILIIVILTWAVLSFLYKLINSGKGNINPTDFIQDLKGEKPTKKKNENYNQAEEDYRQRRTPIC